MALHQFDFTYTVPEYGVIDLDVDAALDDKEKEGIARLEIEESFPDIEEIEITGMRIV